MGHHSCCNKQKVKKGLWSPEEDDKLIKYISVNGHGCWSSVPRLAGNLIRSLLRSIFFTDHLSCIRPLVFYRFNFLPIY